MDRIVILQDVPTLIMCVVALVNIVNVVIQLKYVKKINIAMIQANLIVEMVPNANLQLKPVVDLEQTLLVVIVHKLVKKTSIA